MWRAVIGYSSRPSGGSCNLVTLQASTLQHKHVIIGFWSTTKQAVCIYTIKLARLSSRCYYLGNGYVWQNCWLIIEDASLLASDADLHSRLVWLQINHKKLCSKKIAILWHMQLLCCITIIIVTFYDVVKMLLLSAFIGGGKSSPQHHVIVCMLKQCGPYTPDQRLCIAKARTFAILLNYIVLFAV